MAFPLSGWRTMSRPPNDQDSSTCELTPATSQYSPRSAPRRASSFTQNSVQERSNRRSRLPKTVCDNQQYEPKECQGSRLDNGRAQQRARSRYSANTAALCTGAHFRATTLASEGQGRASLELVLPFEDVEHFENVIIPARDPPGLVLAAVPHPYGLHDYLGLRRFLVIRVLAARTTCFNWRMILAD
jgi:hypothetical protein